MPNAVASGPICRQRLVRPRTKLHSVLVALRWTSFLSWAPGILMVALLVIGWILPALLVIAALLTVQLLVYRMFALAVGPINLRKAACTRYPADANGEDAFTRRQRMLT